MKKLLITLIAALLLLTACNITPAEPILLNDLPEYSGEPWVIINNNEPQFDTSIWNTELSTEPFEYYTPLDLLGRCGTAYAYIDDELMPTEERGNISSVKPSGWQSVRYDFVDGESLYNRCHLIGFQLTGENANENNLITGTRYMNVEGMLPFENAVADYIESTDNRVLYQVTPIFEGYNLVADGVHMMAQSVDKEGNIDEYGVNFNVFCYNVQPGVEIDYANGNNHAAEIEDDTPKADYILNTNSKKFHLPSCQGAADITPKNREEVNESRTILISRGYEPCKSCNP